MHIIKNNGIFKNIMGFFGAIALMHFFMNNQQEKHKWLGLF